MQDIITIVRPRCRVQRLHVRQSGAGPAPTGAGAAGGNMGARRRRAAVRAWRTAADVSVPDQERTRAAHQSREARLLGRPPVARRVRHPRAASECPGATDRRDEAWRPHASRNARPAPREPGLRQLSRAVRLVGLAFEGYGPIGERARSICADGRSIPPLPSLTAARAPGSKACARSCARGGRTSSSIIFAGSSSSMPWAAACYARTSRCLADMRNILHDERLPLRPARRDHRHQPSVRDETLDAASS